MASNKLRTRIVYTSEAVDQMSDAEVRKAYTSIRHIAVERAKRLSKYGYTNTRAGKEAARLQQFPGISQMSSDAEVRQMLLDTSKWLRNPFSKAAEVRKKNREVIKKFRDMKYDFVNESNIIDFLEFMDEMQETYADKNYEYTRIADAYEIAQKYQIPEDELKRDFESWMSKGTMKKIENLEEGSSAADVRAIISSARKKQQLKEFQEKAKAFQTRKRTYGKRKR